MAIEDEILQWEDTWMETRLHGDLAYSKTLIHDSYQGVTPSGEAQNKEQFLNHILVWDAPFTECVQSNRFVVVEGRNATSTGVVSLSSPSKQYSFSYRRVYHNKDGQWYLIASQATAV